MGSKDGIAHIGEAFVNPGDYVLAPSPGYPGLRTGTLFAEGKVHDMPLLRENNFFPSSRTSRKRSAKRGKDPYINYPNNPQPLSRPLGFYKRSGGFRHRARYRRGLGQPVLRGRFDGTVPRRFSRQKARWKSGVEMHSLSKTYNMTGWRIGMAVGNAEILAGLGRVKTNVDSGVFNAVQHAAIAALSGPQDCVKKPAPSTRSAGMCWLRAPGTGL